MGLAFSISETWPWPLFPFSDRCRRRKGCTTVQVRVRTTEYLNYSVHVHVQHNCLGATTERSYCTNYIRYSVCTQQHRDDRAMQARTYSKRNKVDSAIVCSGISVLELLQNLIFLSEMSAF